MIFISLIAQKFHSDCVPAFAILPSENAAIAITRSRTATS
jgi:hypothetical protein